MKLKEITYKKLKELRYNQWLKQQGECPILKQKILFKDSVFDHKHRTKSEKIGEDGKGLLRGVIHFQTNIMEGKIVRIYKRYGLDKFMPLPQLLRGIAYYIENPPMKPEYIHPNEREFKKLGKRDFNRIIKYYFQMYPKRRKLPVYPKSGKTNKEFEKMLEKLKEFEKILSYSKKKK